MEIIYGILLGEQATSWKLEEAIQLFYIGSEGGTVVGGSSSQFPPTENIEALAEQTARYVRCIDFFMYLFFFVLCVSFCIIVYAGLE